MIYNKPKWLETKPGQPDWPLRCPWEDSFAEEAGPLRILLKSQVPLSVDSLMLQLRHWTPHQPFEVSALRSVVVVNIGRSVTQRKTFLKIILYTYSRLQSAKYILNIFSLLILKCCSDCHGLTVLQPYRSETDLLSYQLIFLCCRRAAHGKVRMDEPGGQGSGSRTDCNAIWGWTLAISFPFLFCC